MNKHSFFSRGISTILAIVMILGMIFFVPLTVSAATSGNYEYTVSNGEATITKYNGSETDVVVPSELGGYPVTEIGNGAFRNCLSLTSVTIPESVTSIGFNAFDGCSSLTSIALPDSVMRIGFAFHDTGYYNDESNWEQGVLYIGHYLIGARETIPSDYTVKDGTICIAGCAFDQTGVRNVTIPDSVMAICSGAFEYCYHLESISIGDGVRIIEDGAFCECTSLTSVIIPDGVTSIGESTFAGCIGLTNVEIPDSVMSIGPYAFEYCSTLTSVTIPNGVATIGKRAFHNCSLLTSVTLPCSVRTIEQYAFGYKSDSYSNYSINPGMVMYVGEGTVAKQYAIVNGLRYVVLPELGHDWIDDWTITIEPTCVENGEETRRCSRCGSNVMRPVDALGHDFGEWTMTTDPTCNVNGEQTRYCSRCDEYETRPVDALGHDFGEWTMTTDPTCTTNGEQTRYCSRCDEYETRPVDALGHDYDTVVTNPTCTEQGYSTHTCSRCDDVFVDNYVDALGHNWGSWSVVKNPSCEEDGYALRYCSRCMDTDRKVLEALGHSYKTTVIEPTCTEQGYTMHTCSLCGDSYADTYVDALGHEWGEWTVSTEPSVGGNDIESRTCSRCGQVETREIGEHIHSYDSVVTLPTCTEQGYTTHTCVGCGDSYVDSYVPALGHNWSEWTETTPPSCTEPGEETRTCSHCGEKESKTIDALGHDWDDGVVTTPATDTADGVMTYTCARCGETREEVIPKTGKDLIDTSAIFKDVKPNSWFKKAVDFVFNNGLMNGMTEDTFAPNEPMSRAMLVTVLWRAEGSPAPAGATPFTDLKAKWYKDAVAWAYENEIVKGMTATTFDPNAPLSREQIAAIMYRYSEYRGADVSGSASLDGFPDGAKTHNYAKDAMSWAVYEGLISGTKAGDKVLLDPRGNATRAQVATILMRYLEG